jgi:hypothetical protein
MMKVFAGLGAVLAVLSVLLFVLLARVDPGVDVALELAKAVLTLMTAVLITGVLSAVLGQRNTRQAALDERARVLATALQELKAGYENVQVARFYLSAHRTGRTFEEQIGRLTDARTRLHKVQRERFVLDTIVDEQVQRMLDYITEIANEYRANYLQIARDALAEKRVRDDVEEGRAEDLSAVPLLPGTTFPMLVEFVDDTMWRQGDFHQAYRSAKHQLQVWLDESPGLRVADRR